MKLYIWNRVNHVSASYHSQGGLVIIAASLERARELIAAKTNGAEEPCEALMIEPDLIRECSGPEYAETHPDCRLLLMKWQPIATAPKDGTWFIVHCSNSPMDWEPFELCRWIEPGWRGGYFCQTDTSEELDFEEYGVTHWLRLPLPEPSK